MKNYWFIGDIHGEIGLLDRLLENIMHFSPELLVFVGDYIDRGAYSKEVVDRIRNLEVPKLCLLGNHELMMLNAMEDGGYGYSPIELWYYNGGEATLHSFGFTSFFSFQSEMDRDYLDFFKELKLNHIVEVGATLNLLATHAGISPSISLRDQISLENYSQMNRYMLEKHIEPGDSFLWVRDDFFNCPATMWEGYLVVHGHTPILKLKRFISAHGQNRFLFVDNDLCIRKDEDTGKIVSIDIDSGSVISGRLTGLGFFDETGAISNNAVRMRSITVSAEEIFPRDLGTV